MKIQIELDIERFVVRFDEAASLFGIWDMKCRSWHDSKKTPGRAPAQELAAQLNKDKVKP